MAGRKGSDQAIMYSILVLAAVTILLALSALPFIRAIKVNYLRIQVFRVLAKLNVLKTQLILKAYAIWSGRGIAAVHGLLVTKRSGTIASAATKGAAILIEIIMLAIASYITAFIIPGALTAIATSALTSVSGAVQTLFQTVLSIVIVATIIMLFLSVIVETFRTL